MTLQRWLLLALLTATILCFAFVVLVISITALASGALAMVLVEGAAFVAAVTAVLYAIADLISLAWFATWPPAVLFIVEHWPHVVECWNWLMGE